jgi:Uma2 family endonuclease
VPLQNLWSAMSTVSSPSPQAWSPIWKMSVPAYDRLVAAGVLTEEDPVELLEGWLVKKMPTSPVHDTAVSMVHRQLEQVVPDDWFLRIQSPIETDDSKPEPDVAIVRAPLTRYRQRHPRGADISLLVEVAETSLARDRQKAEVYAREGVAAYWIVNLSADTVECRSDPDPQSGRYQHTVIAQRGEIVPVVIDRATVGQVCVEALLP